MKIIIIISILSIVLTFACKNSNTPDTNEKPIAQVYDKYLYYSDIQDITNYNTTPEDSAINVDNYIKKWINQQLLQKKAELNLSDEELNVSKQIEKYRSRLIINKYEQKIIHQKLDTTFTKQQIKEYYTKYPDNFKLNKSIVKAMVIELSQTAPNIWQIRKWFKSNDEKNMEKAKVYIHDHAKKFEDFNGNWINTDILKSMISIKSNRLDRYLKDPNRNYFEISDSSKIYMIKIDDKKLEGEISPLELTENNIKKILITKRKQELIERIEKEAYNNAIENKKIKIYNKIK